MIYAVVDSESGRVENRIELEPDQLVAIEPKEATEEAPAHPGRPAFSIKGKRLVPEREGENAIIGGTHDGEKFIPPTQSSEERAAYIARARYAFEVCGITVRGMRIKTDRESQMMISNAYAFALRNPKSTIKWKTQDGFVDLDASAVVEIADAINAHVQLAFAKEAEASALTDIEAINKVFGIGSES